MASSATAAAVLSQQAPPLGLVQQPPAAAAAAATGAAAATPQQQIQQQVRCVRECPPSRCRFAVRDVPGCSDRFAVTAAVCPGAAPAPSPSSVSSTSQSPLSSSSSSVGGASAGAGGNNGPVVSLEVVYSMSHPRAPPDVIVIPVSDDDEPFVSWNQVSGLVKWDPDNPSALLDVMLELVQAYKAHHRALALSLPDERLRTDLETYIIAQEGSEVFVQYTDAGPKVMCTVPIPVTLAGICDRGRTLEGNGVATLNLKYTLGGTLLRTAPDVSWVLPSQIESLYDKTLRIPPFPAQSLLVDYIPQVVAALTTPFESILSRRQLFTALKGVLGSPVEWENSYAKISWMYYEEKHEWGAVLTIAIPDNYPATQPTLSLASLVTFSQNRPLTRVFHEYPYSPRWPPAELANRIFNFLKETAQTLKTGWPNEIKGGR
ncbi:BRISC and BRCA1-A complex member 2 [Pelomyxa schiedti]|nr:BRISC and BRCA1-A complex member 2 [Pelomyxa schiedti]